MCQSRQPKIERFAQPQRLVPDVLPAAPDVGQALQPYSIQSTGLSKLNTPAQSERAPVRIPLETIGTLIQLSKNCKNYFINAGWTGKS